MKEVAFFTLILFGLFLVFSGFLMFFYPDKARNTIGKAGSTYLINFAELIPRCIIGIAFVTVETKFEKAYTYIGYFLIVTSVFILLLPIKKHNQFSKMASVYLKPIYLKYLAPISILMGIVLIYGIL